MSLLRRFDPPAYMSDFNDIPGQCDAWHAAMSAWFDSVIGIEEKRIHAPPQYYNPSSFDPGGTIVEQAITWNAFPKELLRRYGRQRALELADMLWPIENYRRIVSDPANTANLSGVLFRPQDEYCEWHVLRNPQTQTIQRITFTSEPPEYWQALFGFVPGGESIPNATFPGDKDRLVQLYRELVSPAVELGDLVARHDIRDTTGHLITAKGQYHLYNKWNTTHGIVHLNAPPNSLVAEVLLGGDATVLRNDAQGQLLVEPEGLICAANYGGPNRNSDPTIGASVNALARLGACVTLRNPVGLYIDHIDLSGWQSMDGTAASEFVRIARGTPDMIERLVIEAPRGSNLCVSDLTIAGVPIHYGGQVAECITVKLIGSANILAEPVRRPAALFDARGFIDPAYPQYVGITNHRTSPLPPGTVQAFRGEGAMPRPLVQKKPGRVLRHGRAGLMSLKLPSHQRRF